MRKRRFQPESSAELPLHAPFGRGKMFDNSWNCWNSGDVKTIEIDNEVFRGLLKHVSDFGETPNSVLRRLLGITEADAASSTQPKLPIQDFIASTEFRFAKGVVGR